MKRALPFILLLCAAGAQAQLYKWVGPDGKVTYSDTPPPPSARQVQTKAVASAAADTSDLPYELATAARNHPVTLYSSANCVPCDDGRKHLNARGIPFTEKVVATNEDIAEFRKINSEGRLPYLTVGTQSQRGFEASLWDLALNAAGYPATSRLPKTYRNPPPAQLAAKAPPPPVAASKESTQAEPAPSPTELPPAAGNAPPGFRF